MPIACLMSLVESYVRHPSCGSNAEPKVTAACNAQRKVMELRFPSPGLRLAVGATPAATTFFKGKVRTTISLNTTRMNSCPWAWREGLQSAVFLPPKADFFYGQRPLFEPWRLLSSCKAWRWGWRGRQEGKLVFRLASPTTTKKRSRQQSPWLFVFTSPTNRSS